MIKCVFNDLKVDSHYVVYSDTYQDLLNLLDHYPNRFTIDIESISEFITKDNTPDSYY